MTEGTNKIISICHYKEGSGPSQLERRDKTASVTVKGQTVGVPVGTVVAQLEEKLTTMEKPVGVNYIWVVIKNQSEGFGP
jgi:HAE1 family hydrophobic/amphiphilic exporter-1